MLKVQIRLDCTIRKIARKKVARKVREFTFKKGGENKRAVNESGTFARRVSASNSICAISR